MREIISSDKNKAISLLKMAIETKERLEELPLEKYPSNSLNDFYDVIHKLLEGIFAIKGVKFSGKAAHFELIEETKEMGILSEGSVSFIQQMRNLRNKFQYEGYSIKPEYITRNKNKIKKIVKTLFEKLKEFLK